jgi:threonine aldolase
MRKLMKNDNTPIDLRSDTVTRPTAAMRQAMAQAEVGDDVFGDDPTVKALEARVAGLLGKEAAIFVPSGTMANQVAIRTHTEPGDEIICHGESHVYWYEAGAAAAISGCQMRLLQAARGIFTPAQLQAVLHADGEADNHACTQKLVVIENTHNRGGGSVWPVEQIAAVELAAREAGLKMHMDGARLWNACIACGATESEYASHFDSVSVCFSKGLGAPVGSALVGTAAFIRRARRFRKQFGGGMRQSGILAAAALYAVEHNRQRLAEDHANARRLAEAIAGAPGIELDPSAVETNMVYFRVTTTPAEEMVKRFARAGVLMLAESADTIRAVAHLDVTADDISAAGERIGQVMGAAAEV